MNSLRLTLLALSLAAAGSSAELAHWSAARPAQATGLELVRAAAGGWKIEASSEGAVATPKPAGDYYRRAEFVARLAKPVPEGAWLTVSYLDKGYGAISISSSAAPVRRGARGVSSKEQWGIVRLNTGKVRRAVTRLQAGAAELHIAGVPQLAGLSVTDSKPAYEQAPMVDPALKLTVPLNLVMGSGADANTPEGLSESLATLRNYLPLVRALGFNGVESYVKWNFVETRPGVFDWSFYDAIVAECEKFDLKWFPLLIVGSAYSMPEWFHDSPEFVPYECLEHHMKTDIPTIFHPAQVKYVQRFLAEFGKHYGSNKTLLGVRLGPSANYGEAQYPATGAWGYKGRPLHTHLGYWVGDPDANAAFRQWLQPRYATIAELNKAWGGTAYASFDDVKTFLPVTSLNDRMRQDFSTWYMYAMTQWCERWATWARQALPNATIFQSSGGWGAVEIGTDYQAHAKSMAKLKGGIRLTNENDSYVNNFCVTRPAASAARFYGARFGTEPAGFGSMRGVMNRLYNIITGDGQHLFYYDGNLYSNDQAVDAWLRYAPLLDQRARPYADVAVFYPETANKLNDSIMRYLGASSFFSAAYAMRSVMDYELVGEQMILDGALDRTKVLVFLAGRVMEKAALDRVDAWVRAGGIVIYQSREGSRQPALTTVEGDDKIFRAWRKGDTGQGRVLFYDWHPVLKDYMAFIRGELGKTASIRPEIRAALAMDKPEDVYWAALENGKLVLLNYGDNVATVRLASGKTLKVEPYAIVIE